MVSYLCRNEGMGDQKGKGWIAWDKQFRNEGLYEGIAIKLIAWGNKDGYDLAPREFRYQKEQDALDKRLHKEQQKAIWRRNKDKSPEIANAAHTGTLANGL